MKLTKLLNKFLVLFVFTVLSLASQAQVWKNEWKGEFTELQVFGRATFELVPDASKIILCEAEGLNSDAVKVSFSGGVCTIKVNNLMKKEENFTVKIKIGYGTLSKLTAGGGAVVISNEIVDVENATYKILSGAQLEAKFLGNRLDLELGQGAAAAVMGELEYFKASATTGASLDAFALVAQTAELKANTGAVINMGETRELRAKAVTGSVISYQGNPEIRELTEKLGGVVEASGQ